MAIASPRVHQLQLPKCPYLSSKLRFCPHLRFLSSTRILSIRASSGLVELRLQKVAENAADAATNATEMLLQRPLQQHSAAAIVDLGTQQSQAVEVDSFACPVCYKTLIRKGPSGLNLFAVYRSAFKCKRCEKSFLAKDMYLDLTVTSGWRDYNEVQPILTELFRSQLVSFLYERGWRQNFKQGGFPGPDEEFNMAQEYLKSAQGGRLVDVSCGSGLFSRKFAKCGTYSGVIALDFSENMLRQCYDLIKKDNTLLDTNLALVRADVSRLPFSSGSVDAVHAGAALHCWPSPSNAIAEIARILRSGGVFVGTTFLHNSSSTPSILRPFREIIARTSHFLTEEEIEGLCKSCGLTNYSSKIQQSFIMFSAQKP